MENARNILKVLEESQLKSFHDVFFIICWVWQYDIEESGVKDYIDHEDEYLQHYEGLSWDTNDCKHRIC